MEPESGYADPGLLMTSLVQRGRELGVQYLQMTPVVEILGSDSRVRGVKTPEEEIEAPVVVDCAGAWANRVARLAGLEVPVEAHREQVVILERPADFTGEHPVLSDLVLLQYMRSETGNLTLLGNSDLSESEVVDPDFYNEETDLEAVENAILKAVQRLPRLEDGQIRKGYSGCYEVTPDYQALIGPVPGLEGFTSTRVTAGMVSSLPRWPGRRWPNSFWTGMPRCSTSACSASPALPKVGLSRG